MGVMLGGETAYRVFHHKRAGICCALHWLNGEPAMALFPYPARLGAQGVMIPLASLHKYANRDGSPTAYLVAKSAEYAQRMAMGADRFTIHHIADVISTHIEDVVKMPPMPDELRKGKGKPIGTMSVIADGKKLIEAEVMDLPPGVSGMTEH